MPPYLHLISIMTLNWNHVLIGNGREAIMIVLAYNMKQKRLDNVPSIQHFWGTPFPGSWPNSYIPMPLNRQITPKEECDPFDVAGTWLRVVCFLDYNDFFNYNFPPHDSLPDNVPRPVIDEGEATRLILMKIHVTRIEAPGPEDGQELPVVHFEGFSRSLDGSWDENANSELRGVNVHGEFLTLRTSMLKSLTRLQVALVLQERARLGGLRGLSSLGRNDGGRRAFR